MFHRGNTEDKNRKNKGMNKNVKNSISRKLLAITLTIVLVSLLILCFVSYRFVYTTNSSSYRKSGTLLLSQAQKQLEELMSSAQSTIDAVHGNPQMQEIIQHSADPDYSLSDQLDDMHDIQKVLPSYKLSNNISDIHFIYERGGTLASISKPITLDRILFLNAMSERSQQLPAKQNNRYVWLTDNLTSLGISDGSDYIALAGTMRSIRNYNQVLGYTLVLQRKDLYISCLSEVLSPASNMAFVLYDQQGKTICSCGSIPEFRINEDIASYNSNLHNADILHLSVPVSSNGWTLSLYLSMDEFTTSVDRYLTFMFFTVVLITISAVAISKLIYNRLIMRRVRQIVSTMDDIGQNDNMARKINISGSDEISSIERHFNSMIDKLYQFRIHEQQMAKNDRINQIKLIHAQINPHFLYNILNTIYWIAQDEDYKSVQKMIKSLSNYYKTGFQPYSESSTFATQITHIQEYVSLINTSKKLCIRLIINIPDKFMEMSVPHFLLQPIVENCIIHGFNQQNDGTISISAHVQAEYIELKIADNGKGLADNKSPSKDSETHYGLENVRRNLELYYNGQADLSLQNSESGGCLVTMHLPIKE